MSYSCSIFYCKASRIYIQSLQNPLSVDFAPVLVKVLCRFFKRKVIPLCTRWEQGTVVLRKDSLSLVNNSSNLSVSPHVLHCHHVIKLFHLKSFFLSHDLHNLTWSTYFAYL